MTLSCSFLNNGAGGRSAWLAGNALGTQVPVAPV
jgi:hypothetical protein